MPDSQTAVHKAAWGELFPWLVLFRSVKIALMARVLVLGAVGLIATTLGWRLIGGIFGDDDIVVKRWNVSTHNWLWDDAGFTIDLSARNTEDVLASARRDLAFAPVDIWRYLTGPFRHMFDADLRAAGFFCMLLAAVWELLVWGIVGGAIARIAALKYTRNEAPSFSAAVRHALAKLPSYSLAPLIALAGAGVFAAQLLVLGIVMNVNFLALVAAVIWPFVLLLGLLMAILLIGALVGWPLMWATVAVEGTDAFDALSRSYAYTYQRPWRLLWYVAFSVFLAAISMFAVKAFAISAVRLGDWSVSWGLVSEEREPLLGSSTAPAPTALPTAPLVAPILPPPLQPDATGAPPSLPAPDDVAPAQAPVPHGRWTINAAHDVIVFWQWLWKSLAAGYQAAFIWVSAVGIYLLLRRDIDGAELDEVFVDPDEEIGIPALEEEPETGVPGTAPGGAQPGDAALPPSSG